MTADAQPGSPDQLTGCIHPRENPRLIGQTDAEQTFLSAKRHDRMHHAWLLYGREGIGKATLAYRIAAYVLANGSVSSGDTRSELTVDRDAADVHLILAGTHPNLTVITRGWNEKTKQFSSFITIDHVRELQRFLGNTAGKGKWRVVIIDRADDLNVSAANALLKMLEEPPAYCLFLLVSVRPGALPLTIRSRCRKLHLQPLPLDELEVAVRHVAELSGIALPKNEAMEFLMSDADGSVRRALEFAQGDMLSIHKEVTAIFDLLPRLDHSRSIDLAERLGNRQADQDYATFLQLLFKQMARRVRSLALSNAADKRLLAHWAELWETMTAMRHEVDRLNLDRASFLLELFAHLEDVARKAGPLKG